MKYIHLMDMPLKYFKASLIYYNKQNFNIFIKEKWNEKKF